MNPQGPGEDSSARSSATVEARGLTKRYRAKIALSGVDLVVERGQWVALLGPNGSGKSTLMRILATLDRPSAGEARILGWSTREHAGATYVRARLGVVFQSLSLDPLLSVRENLMTSAAMYGLGRREARERAEHLARELDIADRLDDRVGTLSGGLARRADLARALLHEPELLLLDEASAGLDLGARMGLLDLLDRARRGGSSGRGMTIISATHMMDEGERGDRVVMMHRGGIVADAPATELRAARGQRLLRVEDTPAAREALARAGLGAIARADADLDTSKTHADAGGEIVVALDAERERAIVSELLRVGAALRVGPATLGDVYLALTGASLSEARGAA